MMDTARLRAFLARLERLDAEDQHDAIVNEMMEAGGKFGPLIGIRQYRLSLHGVYRTGPSKSFAISAWIDAARKPGVKVWTQREAF